MGESKIGLDESARLVRCLTVGGAAGRVGGEVCRNLSLNIAANSASAEMVLSPT
jgi:hypothetical protein